MRINRFMEFILVIIVIMLMFSLSWWEAPGPEEYNTGEIYLRD